MFTNENYEALVRLGEAKQQQYMREAEQHRLIREARSGQTGVWRRAAWAVGPLVLALGEWLLKGKDICEEVAQRRGTWVSDAPQR